MLLKNSQEFANRGRHWAGYSYDVPNQWQGKVNNYLKVIGDKKGDGSVLQFSENPQIFKTLYQKIEKPIKFIHVIRNPYDNISTICNKSLYPIHVINNLEASIDYYFELCQLVEIILTKEIHSDDVFEVNHELLVKNPKNTLEKICHFLEVEPIPSYLQDCASIVFPSVKKTRYSISWPEELIERVRVKVEEIPFLRGYSYND